MAFLIFIVALPIFLLFLLPRINSKSTARLPPGPKGLPFVGNLAQIDNSNRPKYLWQLSKIYGPLVSLRLGSRPVLVVSSAKWAEEIMKTQDLEFCSRPAFTGQQKLSYGGLDLAFTPYSPYWRDMRKLSVVHLFSSKKVQTFRPVREDEVSRLLEKISKSAVDSKPVNLSVTMTALTSAIICRVAFGKRYDDGDSQKDRFDGLLRETQVMFGSFFISDYFPYMGWIDHVSGLMGRLEKNFREFDVFYQEIIDEHLDPKRPEPDNKSILDVLLDIWKDRSSEVELTFDHIKAILMNVFVGATETSAATVVWAMTFLMKNPETMKKAQEEVRNLVGKKGSVDEDDLQQLPYIKAVVKETLRMQPTIPLMVPRETTQKCQLGKYEVPAKTIVFVNAWAVGRDPEAWEKPFDFYPDRFIGSSIDMKGHNFELIPFGGGRRICPGLFFGTAVVELAVANLLYKFDWEMPAGLKREDLDTDLVFPGLAGHKTVPLWLVPRSYV